MECRLRKLLCFELQSGNLCVLITGRFLLRLIFYTFQSEVILPCIVVLNLVLHQL